MILVQSNCKNFCFLPQTHHTFFLSSLVCLAARSMAALPTRDKKSKGQPARPYQSPDAPLPQQSANHSARRSRPNPPLSPQESANHSARDSRANPPPSPAPEGGSAGSAGVSSKSGVHSSELPHSQGNHLSSLLLLSISQDQVAAVGKLTEKLTLVCVFTFIFLFHA